MRSAMVFCLVLAGSVFSCSICRAQGSGPDATATRDGPLPSHYFLGDAVQFVAPYAADVGDPYDYGLGAQLEAGYFLKSSRLYLSLGRFTATGDERQGPGTFEFGEMRAWYLLGNWDVLFLGPHNFASPYMTLIAGLKAVHDQGTSSVDYGAGVQEESWLRDENVVVFGAGLGVDMKMSSAIWIGFSGRLLLEARKDDNKLQHPDVFLGIRSRIRL